MRVGAMEAKLAETEAKAAGRAAGAAHRPTQGMPDPGPFGNRRAGHDPRAFGPNEWLEANLTLEAHYLTLSRLHIDEMCQELQPALSEQIRKALANRLRDRSQSVGPTAGDDPAAAAGAAVADLAGDLSWALSWEETKELVAPYAKESWLLARIQSYEEGRLIAIYAGELTKEIAGYVQELILRAYGVATPDIAPSDAG